MEGVESEKNGKNNIKLKKTEVSPEKSKEKDKEWQKKKQKPVLKKQRNR